MAGIYRPPHERPVAIAPAPSWTSSADDGANGNSSQVIMPYACQTCSNRKIKCDKVTPTCSSCRRNKSDCLYQAPPPRKRKRRLSGDGNEKLARYERILRQYDLLPPEDDSSPSLEDSSQEPITLRFQEPGISRTGKLLASQGKSRYINSNLWRNFGDDEMQHMSDEEEEEWEEDWTPVSPDPLTGAFLGHQLNLLQYHPTHTEAMLLWKTHRDNVEPLHKILHIPSTSKMVETTSQQPITASKTEECLLFAIYHFAVFSMTEEECEESLEQSRGLLLQRYHFAARQALVNASFLKTTEMSILQALVLFLSPCRFSYDAHTNWILTGVAVRIAQRMGLHRDGEKLGLPPYDVEMRRRLFYQLLPLDGMASQTSGTGIAIGTWDTEQPLNINDDQIWPEMTEKPKEQKQATEMMFCLARQCVGKYFAKSGTSIQTGPWPFTDYIEAESTISEAESEVEEKFIRYCDIVNPLHFMTICQARSAITAMRLRVRLPKHRNQTATDTEKKEIFELAQKIIDTDATACANTSLKRFWWVVRSFFAFGSWDSLIVTLTSLRTADLLSPAETDTAWNRVEQIYSNRKELLESKRALHIAVGRLALKAWDANPANNNVEEPAFITRLRSRNMRHKSRVERQPDSEKIPDSKTEALPQTNLPLSADANALFASIPADMGIDITSDFSIDTADWMFWDHLIRDYQSQGAQQQGVFAQ